jgi:UDP-glucose 4-epimerase
MKLLITGYPGFLGRHMARALKKEGYRIRVLLHRRTVTRKEFSEEADECLWGSVLKEEDVRKAVAGVEGVIHCAWAFHPPTPERPTPNERGTELLFKESLRAGVKVFLFISSVAVYGMEMRSDSRLSESSPLATGDDLLFLYPAEKIACENILLSSERKGMRLGIFRPGPIFSDEKSPMKKILTIAGHSFALGIGNGLNRMGFIHAEDVVEAVAKWLKNGEDGAIFNVTPTDCLKHKDWYCRWAEVHKLRLTPVFIPGYLIRLAAFGVVILKRWMGKETRSDINYAILSATRNIQYNSEMLKRSLDWKDEATARYTWSESGK